MEIVTPNFIEIVDAASTDVSLTLRAVERWPNLNIIIS